MERRRLVSGRDQAGGGGRRRPALHLDGCRGNLDGEREHPEMDRHRLVGGRDQAGGRGVQRPALHLSASPLGLVYTPAAGAHGTGLASISFHVQDSGGTANGGINRDQTANTITFNVTPVSYAINSAPSGADTTITITENTPYTFSVADFGFTDPNDSPADGFQSVTITALPLDGTLTLNGTPVQAGDSIILPQAGAARPAPGRSSMRHGERSGVSPSAM